jgi:hypothetical protein
MKPRTPRALSFPAEQKAVGFMETLVATYPSGAILNLRLQHADNRRWFVSWEQEDEFYHEQPERTIERGGNVDSPAYDFV